jgi:Protein of unknown function (DUF3311)
MKRVLLAALVAALYVLHQDVWFWDSPSPLAFGFIPIGLFYHACFAVAASLLMWMLVKYAWPSHLEREATQDLTSSRIDAQEGDVS